MRFVASSFLALGLAACATAPGAPDYSDGDGGLRVCPGRVANAPASDNAGRVRGFSPIVQVAGSSLLRAPVEGCVSSGFGPRRGGAGAFHEGLDIFTRSPRAVVAGGDGVVEFIGSQRGYGRTVVIRHSARVKTRYAHLSSYERGLREGARISRGEAIGETGRSGNATAVHLHYEILINGRPVNPLTVGN